MASVWRVGGLAFGLMVFVLFAGLCVPLVDGHVGSSAPPDRGMPATTAPGTIGNVSFTGSAVTTNSVGRLVIWHDRAFTATINYTPPAEDGYEVCLWAKTPAHRTCKDPVFDPQNSSSLRFGDITWPANETGSVGFVAEIRSNDEVIYEYHGEVIALHRNGSYDGDSLDNHREIELNTSALVADTDTDGLRDGEEIRTYHTDPLNPDSDYDGLNDAREIEIGTNPNDADTDNDGVEDGRELDVGASPFQSDTDGDGLSDQTELRWGTDPANPWTPVYLGIGVLAVLAVVGVLVSRRWGLVPIRWVGNAHAILALPSLSWQDSNGRDGATNTESGTTHPSAATDEGPDTPSDDGDSVDYVETDTERVLKLLNQHNGRIRQSQLVEANDWSASKVSRLLSEMEESGEVSRVTIGRENIVTLPGEEPGGSVTDSK